MDLGTEQLDKLRQPGRMRGPGGRRDELAIGDGVRDGDVGIRAARQCHFRRAGGIGGNALAADDIGRGQQLRAVADGRL